MIPPQPGPSKTSWPSIEAEYLGGNPDRDKSMDGLLSFREGALVFGIVVQTPGAVPPRFETLEWRLDRTEIRAISLGSRDYARMLTRAAAGVLIGGSIGGLVGMATSRRNATMLVNCDRDGFVFTVVFGVLPKEGRQFLDAIQKARRGLGESPIPTIEELSKLADAEAQDEQTVILGDIRDLLREQVALLRRLAGEPANV